VYAPAAAIERSIVDWITLCRNLLEELSPDEGGASMDQPARREAVEIVGEALGARSIETFCDITLPLLCRTSGTSRGLIYISDPRLPVPYRSDQGFLAEASAALDAACAEWFERILDRPSAGAPLRCDIGGGSELDLLSLPVDGRIIGMIGLPVSEGPERGTPPASDLLAALARVVDHLADRATAERKLMHLNTYLTISSMLARSVDLEELLEVALYCSMEAVSAEAASILLLDDPKENFRFFRVEGAAKPLLGGATFPATEGVAGRVLRTGEAEIVNDAESDEQFYGKIDLATGFRTRNMIAVPLTAGDEPIGVLEVLNRTNGDRFKADEKLVLVSVADEVAFAVRNATIFDYVIGTYCKRRQGENSCKGCERPLGSWTPCMRYREFQP
jgi:GAF domain-containing protein